MNDEDYANDGEGGEEGGVQRALSSYMFFSKYNRYANIAYITSITHFSSISCSVAIREDMIAEGKDTGLGSLSQAGI